MKLKRLSETLIRHEGLRLKPYRCTAGKLTIGVGRNLDDVGITKEEALILLESDVKNAVKSCQAIFGDNWKKLDDIRQEVMINMCFNLGQTRLSKFKNMIAAVKAGDYMKAGDEMLSSRWAKQVSKRAYELALAMKTGKI